MGGIQATLDEAIDRNGIPAIDDYVARNVLYALRHAGGGNGAWRQMTDEALTEAIAVFIHAGIGPTISKQVCDLVMGLRDQGIICPVPGSWSADGAWVPSDENAEAAR
jgi:methyl coenzyme M reductase subunit C